MTIRQGFHRLGVSVAIAFIGLSLVSLFFAAANYWQYSIEIGRELPKWTKSRAGTSQDLAAAKAAVVKSADWQRFKTARYRSVGQALDLAGLCLLASLISLIFWNAIGLLYTRLSPTTANVPEAELQHVD